MPLINADTLAKLVEAHGVVLRLLLIRESPARAFLFFAEGKTPADLLMGLLAAGWEIAPPIGNLDPPAGVVRLELTHKDREVGMAGARALAAYQDMTRHGGIYWGSEQW